MVSFVQVCTGMMESRTCSGNNPGEGHFPISPVGDMPTFSVFILSKNFRTGFKISVKIPEQASQKPMIFWDVTVPDFGN